MEHLYWSIAVILFGPAIGSFLNVVIFRWPRGLSIQQPVRSFCPACGAGIAWYDNVPVLSYLILRGRCRRCHAPISMQYPLVEIATAMLFLITYDTFFVARERLGVGDLARDWPILVAHCVLWAGLLALTVMDLEWYMVDIWLTWFVAAVGLIAHAVWTPAHSDDWIRPGAAGALFSLLTVVGLVIGYLLWRPHSPLAEPEEAPPGAPATPREPATARWAWILVPAAVLAAYWLAMVMFGEQPPYRPTVPRLTAEMEMTRAPQGGRVQMLLGLLAHNLSLLVHNPGLLRLLLGLIALFLGLAIAASAPRPEVYEEVWGDIESEARMARLTALRELRMLAPAVLLGLLALVLVTGNDTVDRAVSEALMWSPTGQWRPLWGIATALEGWIIGGAVGWLARVVFTLVLGKEALGMGDVHLMAAAGAVAGWPVAIIGFFLASLLTLLALGVVLLLRRRRALPYVPWLALAFLVATVFQDRILAYFGVRWLLVGSV